MPPSGTSGEPTVLIVSDLDDDAVHGCASALTAAGAGVVVVPDVYSAMARLALGMQIARVVLDVRTLDQEEMSFLQVASRYYASVEVLIPAFDGAADRIKACRGTGDSHVCGAEIEVVDVPAIVASLNSISTSVPPSENHRPGTADQPSAPPADPPSAGVDVTGGTPMLPDEGARPSLRDQGPGPSLRDEGPGPSMHDAVRRRMAGDDPRAPRRAPPGGAPGAVGRASLPAETPASPTPPAGDPTPAGTEKGFSVQQTVQQPLSPEEVDALLAGEEANEGDKPGTGDADGEETS